jgi:hypothetical protein
MCERKDPDRKGQICVINGKRKSLHDESSCAIALHRVAVRIRLNAPNSIPHCVLEV